MIFKDVDESHWAYEAIKELSDDGILVGYEDGTFKPDEPGNKGGNVRNNKAVGVVVIDRIH